MKYKMINRDNIDFTSDADVCNIGYIELYVDEIPIRLEKFYTRKITCVTIFIPMLESLKTEEDIKKYLVEKNLIKIIDDNIYITEIEDIDDDVYISINIPIEDNDKIINECNLEFNEYN